MSKQNEMIQAGTGNQDPRKEVARNWKGKFWEE
jgi:hypothetical protein